MAYFNEGYIYVIINDAWDGWCKIGRTTTSIEKRLMVYQTSSPFRDYKCAFSIYTSELSASEKLIYEELEAQGYENKHEWYNIPIKKAEQLILDKTIM